MSDSVEEGSVDQSSDKSDSSDKSVDSSLSSDSSPSNMAEIMSGGSAETPQSEDGEPESSRPEFLLEKFKTVEDQAKAYIGLEKISGKAKSLDGVLGVPEGGYKIPDKYKDSSLVKEMTEYYKEKGFSQDFLEKHLEFVEKYENSAISNTQEELAKLGDNGGERLNTLKQWLTNNFDSDIIDSLKHVPIKAGVIKFFEEIKSMTTQTGVPTETAQTVGSESIEDIKKEIRENKEKARTDQEYALELNNRFLKAGGKAICKPA